MGFVFEVMKADIDERAIRDEDPVALVQKLAQAKADAIAPNIEPPAMLICGDQVVVCDGRILEKPVDADEARTFLRLYATHAPEIVGSLCVVNIATGERAVGYHRLRVVFKTIPEEAIEQFIKDGIIFHAAGGFYAEDPSFAPYVVSIEGTLDACMGVPKELLFRLMKQVGWVDETPKT